jgi:soluble cytochrome b562
MEKKEYKSPPHKLRTFFKKSRDVWREKAEKRQDIIRDLNAKVRDVKKSRSKWKEEAKDYLESSKELIIANKMLEKRLEKAHHKIKELEETSSGLKKNLL